MKNLCNTFPTLKGRLCGVKNSTGNQVIGDGLISGSIYSLIRMYNTYRIANGMRSLNDENTYTDDEVRQFAEDIAKINNGEIRIVDYQARMRDALLKLSGTPEALAGAMLTGRISGSQLEELKSDVINTFMGVVGYTAKQSNMSIDDYMDNLTSNDIVSIMNAVKSNILSMAMQNRDGFAVGTEEYNNVNDLITSVFGVPNAGSYSDSILENVITLVIPTINRIFDVRINSDLTVSKKSDIIDEESDYRLEDMEETSPETWQQDPDSLNPVNSMSGTVNRLLMLVPKVDTKTIKTYFRRDGSSVVKIGNESDVNKLIESISDDKRDEFMRGIFVSYDSVTTERKSTLTGKTMLSNPSNVARRIFDLLNNCSTGEEMIGRLKRSERYGKLAALLERNPIVRNTFVSNFNKYTQEARCTTVTVNKDGSFDYGTPELNSTNSKDNSKGFVNNLLFKKVPSDSIFNVSLNRSGNKNNVTVNPKRVALLYNEFYGFNGDINGNGRTIGVKDVIDNYIKNNGAFLPDGNITSQSALEASVSSLLSRVGLSVPQESIYSIVNNPNNLRVFLVNMDRLISNLYSDMNNMSINKFEDNIFISPAISNLMKLSSSNDYGKVLSGMFSYGGKKQSARILPSTMTALFKKLHTLRGDELRKYLEDKFLDSDFYSFVDRNGNRVIFNRLLSDFYNLADASNADTSILDEICLSRDMGIDGSLAEDSTSKEQYLMNITTYLNNRTPKEFLGRSYTVKEGTPFATVNGYDIPRKDYAYIPSFVTGDNNTARYFKLPHYEENEVYDGIYNLYLSDRYMMQFANAAAKKGLMFKANDKEAFTNKRNRYGILQFLNDVDAEIIANATPEGTTIMDKNSFIETILKPYLEESFEDFKTSLRYEGLLDVDANGKPIHFGKYADNLDRLDTVLYDYFLNYKFGMYNMSNISHVTPAFFNGVEDHQKRNKGVLTNGYQPIIDAVNKDGSRIFSKDTFKAVYFTDISVSVDDATRKSMWNTAYNHFLKTLSESEARKSADSFVAKFDKNTITDGEAYRSFDSYRNILASIGEPFWNNRKENAYRRIKEIIGDKSSFNSDNNLTFDAMDEINDLMLVMQPIKPINDGIESWRLGQTNTRVGFQLKYAEVPILPEMYPAGSKLRQIGEWMRDNDVELMASTKCAKKGCFGEFDIQYKTKDGSYIDNNGKYLPGLDENGVEVKSESKPNMVEQRRFIQKNKTDNRVEYTTDTSFDEIMSNQTSLYENGRFFGGIVHELPFESMLIQNNVPDHTDSQSILGTQGRKIIDSAIRDDVTYKVNGVDVNGKDFKKIYNALHTAKYAKSFEKFMSMVKNSTLLQRNLVFTLLNNDRTNPSFVDRIAIDSDGNPAIPFAELSSNGDINAALMSMFRKSVIRQTIDGGSIVQASSLGVGGEAVASRDLKAIIKDGNIVGVESEIPFDFSYKDERGNKTKLKYDDYCNADGTFKTDKNGNTLIENDYPGILDIVCYRIPTEKEYSMFRMYVKRVTPKGCANSIKLPAECTTIAGFDFDIDKLFLMRHNYTVSNKKFDNEKVWNEIYSYNGEEMSSRYYVELNKARLAMSSANRRGELEDLAESFGVKPDELKLHQYWEKSSLANEDKNEVYSDALKRLNMNSRITTGSTFRFDKSGRDILSMSVDEINNALVDMYLSVLSDPSTSMARIEQGGFDGASESARVMRVLSNLKGVSIDNKNVLDKFIDGDNVDFTGLSEYLENSGIDYKPEYDYSDPETAVILRQLNQAAGNLIGINANDNVNAFISTKLETLRFNDDSRILFGSLSDGKVKELDGKTGDISDSEIGCSLLFRSVNGVDVLKNLAQMLAASVDAVKDPVLNYLNLNTITADAAGMLLRLGYTTNDVGLLFNQPVITEACKYMRYNGINNVTVALKKVLMDKYGVGDVDNMFRKGTYDPSMLTQDKLASAISNVAKKSDIDRIQIQAALLFNRIILNTKELSNYIQSTRNTSANVVKSRFADEISSEQKSGRKYKVLEIKSNDSLENPITSDWSDEKTAWASDGNINSLHESLKEFMDKYSDHPFEYENMVYNITRYTIDYLMGKFTPYKSDTYDTYLSEAKALIAPWGMSGDVIDLLLKQIPMIVASRSAGIFNPNGKTNGVSNKEYYTNGFMERLAPALNGELNEYADTQEKLDILMDMFENNEFLSRIDIEKLNPEVEDSPDVLKFDYSYNISQEEKAGITNAFRDLADKFPELADDIIMNFYYSKGMNPTYNNIMGLIPVESLRYLWIDGNTRYIDMFSPDSDINSGINHEDAIRDITKFMLMNAYNTDVVPKMPFNLNDTDVKQVGFDTVVTLSGINKSSVEFMHDKDYSYIKPVINIDGNIYQLIDSYDLADGKISRFGEDFDTNIISIENNTVSYALVEDSAESSIYANKYNGYMYGVYNIKNDVVEDSTKTEIETPEATAPEVNPATTAANQAKADTKNNPIINPDGTKVC